MGRTPRQAARQPLAAVRQGGEDLQAVVRRQRNVDTTVAEGVWRELLQTPLAGPTEGHAHEAWLWTTRLESRSVPVRPPAGWNGPSAEGGMRLAAPTALAALVPPELPLAQGPGSLGWLTFLRPLGSWPVPLSGVGRWCGVPQTTM